MMISLCIPTNGICEWVFPCLDSIYQQNINENKFEVIVTDNGNNKEFQDRMESYCRLHSNIVYSKTNAYMFDNQLEALKLAKGDYIKFVNHRAIWMPGRLRDMLAFLEKYEKEKPVIYFSNGVMGWGPRFEEYGSFDEFVKNLGIYATWTTGVGIWKEDYDKIPHDLVYDKISPHSSILFSDREKNKYIINDKYWMQEIENDHRKKGKYDLYKAFSLDEFIITINLYRDGDISIETLKTVKKSFEQFLIELYCDFNLFNKPCSYDLDGFDKYVDIFFDKEEILKKAKQRFRKLKQ